MKVSGLSNLALGIGLVQALLTGCSGSQLGQPLPNSVSLSKYSSPSIPGSDLLYISYGTTYLLWFSYPKIAPVGKLNLGLQNLEQICSDTNGDVFVPGKEPGSYNFTWTVEEYAHGGTTPIESFGPFHMARGAVISSCASDPASKDFSVVSSDGGVAVYAPGSPEPTGYSLPGLTFGGSSYDDSGDLFISVVAPTVELAELKYFPSIGWGLTQIPLNESLQIVPGLAWDGSYVVLESSDGSTLYKISVSGSNGTIVGKVRLKGHPQASPEIWKSGKTMLSMCCAGKGPSGGDTIGFYRYPKGGAPYSKLPGEYFSDYYGGIAGFTISVPPSSK